MANAYHLASEQAVRAIRVLHQPTDEEAESWYGDEGDHDQRFSECPSVAGTGECPGHTFTVKVCRECGYLSTQDYEVAYRPWPCPTICALPGDPTERDSRAIATTPASTRDVDDSGSKGRTS